MNNGQSLDDDASLVERLKRGDMEALSILYERHKDALYTYCIHIGVGDIEAHDTVQDVFVRIHSKIGSLGDNSSFRPWALTIARHLIFNGKRNNHLSYGETPDTQSHEKDPLELAVEQSDSDWLWSSIHRLDSATREVLLLRIEQELSYAEIALVLGVSIESVRSRLHRARKVLIEHLHRKGGKTR